MHLLKLDVRTMRAARHIFCNFATFTLALLALGWATSGTASGIPGRFEHLRAQDLRVASVGYRLAISNHQLCHAIQVPQLGFVVHDLAQYAPADRAGAAHAFALGSQISVMVVIDGSPAARAGLRAGDEMVSVNGRALNFPLQPEAPPTMKAMDRAQRIVREEMGKGAITLRVSAADGTREIRFTADAGCPSNVQFVSGGNLNAWADGERVMVGDAIVRHCPSDDDLALVIAHELAHNLLRHRQWLAKAGISGSRLLPGSAVGMAKVRATEEEADRLAVRMVSAAGYDLSRAASFLGGLLEAGGLSGTTATTHPRPERRIALLKASIARLGSPGGVALYSRSVGIANTARSGFVSGSM